MTVKPPWTSWESLTDFQLHFDNIFIVALGLLRTLSTDKIQPITRQFFLRAELCLPGAGQTAAGELIVLLTSLKSIITAFLLPEDDEFFFKNIHYKTVFSHPVYELVGESSCEIHKTVTMS